MVGVVLGGWVGVVWLGLSGSDDLAVLMSVGGEEEDEEGRKDIDNVPEKRTIETAREMGRIAVPGLG